MYTRTSAACAAIAASFVLPGCSISTSPQPAQVPAQVIVQPAPATRVVTAPMPPPPARSELVPPPPVGPSAWVWQPGHWQYTNAPGNPWVWQEGRYVAPPGGVTRWVPGTWVRSPAGGWSWMEGHWA